MTAFHISLSSRKDLSGEIYRQIRRAILNGRLSAGNRLPPSRDQAKSLMVSRATVTNAYERLASEGFVVSRLGDGTYVSERIASDQRVSGKTRSSGVLEPRPVWQSMALPTAFAHSAQFDFRSGLPDAALFPHRTWRRLVGRALRANESASYDHAAGNHQLRTAIARHIGISRGVETSADDILITNGTQQALDLLARVLLVPGDRVAVEDPGYAPPRRLFTSWGLRVVGVPVDADGIVVDALPRTIRAVYVTPSHQYPLGVSMSLARRRALLAWADRNNAAIIEDDYDSEFRFAGRPLDPLQTLDASGRVIYVGTFSKTLLPSLRLGFLVAPPSLRDALHKAKFVTDWHSPTLAQTALARFIEDGGFARHLRRVSKIYGGRHGVLTRTIERHFTHWLELVPSTTGLHVAARAPSGSVAHIAQVVARAQGLGVAVQQLASFAVGDTMQPGLVFGYGGIRAERIEKGLRILRQCFVSTVLTPKRCSE